MTFFRFIFYAVLLGLAAMAYRRYIVHDVAHNPRKYAEEFNVCFMCRNCPQQCPVADTFPRHKYAYKEAANYGKEKENPRTHTAS